jgi:hypothetical protein
LAFRKKQVLYHWSVTCVLNIWSIFHMKRSRFCRISNEKWDWNYLTVRICTKVFCFQIFSKLKPSHSLEANYISSILYWLIFLQSL